MQFVRMMFLLVFVSSPLTAQAGGDVFARARRLVNDGAAQAGRALVDSALAAAPAGSAAYVEALYWRGVLAEAGEAARTDLMRVAIEFPLSPRASEALLRLAQLELTRGDRVAARRYLDRLLKEHTDAPSHAAGQYWMGRLLLEDAKPGEACTALRDARHVAPPGDVELINQIDYYARPCDAIEATAASADSTATDQPRAPDKPHAAPGAGRWSVQLAAYGDRESAQALVKKLRARGVDARVTADKPWRVRVGRYATRAEAAGMAQRFSTKQAKAFVVEAEGR